MAKMICPYRYSEQCKKYDCEHIKAHKERQGCDMPCGADYKCVPVKNKGRKTK